MMIAAVAFFSMTVTSCGGEDAADEKDGEKTEEKKGDEAAH